MHPVACPTAERNGTPHLAGPPAAAPRGERDDPRLCLRASAEVRPITSHLLQPTPLATYVVADGQHSVLVLCGELDIATAGHVWSAMQELRRAGATSILIDLRSLEFMDTQGAHILLALQHECDLDDIKMVLVAGRREVQRVFDLTRTSSLFDWSALPEWAAL